MLRLVLYDLIFNKMNIVRQIGIYRTVDDIYNVGDDAHIVPQNFIFYT